MAVQSSGNERGSFWHARSVLLRQTGLLRLTEFCHALFCFGCINTNTWSLGFCLRVGFTRLWSSPATWSAGSLTSRLALEHIQTHPGDLSHLEFVVQGRGFCERIEVVSLNMITTSNLFLMNNVFFIFRTSKHNTECFFISFRERKKYYDHFSRRQCLFVQSSNIFTGIDQIGGPS